MEMGPASQPLQLVVQPTVISVCHIPNLSVKVRCQRSMKKQFEWLADKFHTLAPRIAVCKDPAWRIELPQQNEKTLGKVIEAQVFITSNSQNNQTRLPALAQSRRLGCGELILSLCS